MFTCIICIILIIVSDNFSINHVHLVSFFKIECTSYPVTRISRHSFGHWEHDMHSLHVYMYYICTVRITLKKIQEKMQTFIWSIVVWHVDLTIFHGRYEYDSFTKIQELYLTTDNMKNQETFITCVIVGKQEINTRRGGGQQTCLYVRKVSISSIYWYPQLIHVKIWPNAGNNSKLLIYVNVQQESFVETNEDMIIPLIQ